MTDRRRPRSPDWGQVAAGLRERIHAHAQECTLCLPIDRDESLVSTGCHDGLLLLSELLTALNHLIAAGDLNHALGPVGRVRLGDEP